MIVRYKDIGFHPDRDNFVLDQITGKSVLHIGACNAPKPIRQFNEGLLLHAKLGERAKSLIGIDVCKDSIEQLASIGITNIEYKDANTLNSWNRKFDVIVVGEMIEHVSDPSGLLEGIKACLEPEGKVIISTPNLFSFYWFYGVLRGHEAFNDDHCLGFSMGLLTNLLERHGFHVDNRSFSFLPRSSFPFWRKVIRFAAYLRKGFSETLIVVGSVKP